MINAIGPVIGQWYRHLDKGETFQVIAADTGEGLVEVQFIGGDIEEIPRDEWQQLEIATCAPPEDWTGPYDVAERDDLGYSETETAEQDWHDAGEGVPARPEAWQETGPAAERDQWSGRRRDESFAEQQEEAHHVVRP